MIPKIDVVCDPIHSILNVHISTFTILRKHFQRIYGFMDYDLKKAGYLDVIGNFLKSGFILSLIILNHTVHIDKKVQNK